MLPPMNRYSIAQITTLWPSSVPAPQITASLRPVFSLASFRRSSYDLRSVNRKALVDRRLPPNSSHEPSSNSIARRCRAEILKWNPHLAQTIP